MQLKKHDGDPRAWIADETVEDPKTTFKVKGWNLLIRPWKPPTQTASGFYLPDTFHDDLSSLINVGRVLQIGDQCWSDKEKYGKPWCKVGDYVLYAKHTGTKIKFGEVALVLLADDRVLGTMDSPDEISADWLIKEYMGN